MDSADKVLENRLRRMAERQGYRLVKSRRRDPRAFDYGRWQLQTAGPRPGAWTRSSWITLGEVRERLEG